MDDDRKNWPVSITVLAVLAVFYTLYFARSFLLPIVFALLFDFLLSPAVRALVRWHVPVPLAAGIVLLALVGVGGLCVYDLSGPVQDWAEHAPETLATAQSRLRRLLKPLQRMTKTAEQVESAAGGVAGGGTGTTKPTEVVVRGPSVVSRLFGSTQRFLAGLLEVMILLYFLLAAGDLFLQKLIRGLPNVRDRNKAIEIAKATEESISTYLLTTLTVNAIEGAVVAAALYALGMPNPVLWGALVILLEFIPYLGALSLVVILTLGAVASFNDVGHALLIPVTFFTINLIQANVVSPLLLGHRLALNPVALLVSLAFWFWIWGIPGGLLAVPLLATLKIFCDHIERLAPLGEFLGRRDVKRPRVLLRRS
ncbi:MAG TPA: AI-2E family transporter [Gemmatimonadales bacterium]